MYKLYTMFHKSQISMYRWIIFFTFIADTIYDWNFNFLHHIYKLHLFACFFLLIINNHYVFCRCFELHEYKLQRILNNNSKKQKRKKKHYSIKNEAYSIHECQIDKFIIVGILWVLWKCWDTVVKKITFFIPSLYHLQSTLSSTTTTLIDNSFTVFYSFTHQRRRWWWEHGMDNSSEIEQVNW